MAKAAMTRAPAFVADLRAALQRELRGAQVQAEQIRGNRYRFEVLWERFSGVGHPERQKRVWAIAERVVPGPRLLDVGMILTLAPEEIAQRMGRSADSVQKLWVRALASLRGALGSLA